MGTKRTVLLTANALTLAAAVTFAPSASALYVGMYAIGDFVPGASGGCGSDDRSSWPGMAQAWWDEMGAKGHYRGPAATPYKYINGNMTIRRFCDPQLDPNCRDYQSSDPSGVDWMDAAIIATHGWDDGDHWGAVMRWPDLGDCALRFGGSSPPVPLGGFVARCSLSPPPARARTTTTWTASAFGCRTPPPPTSGACTSSTASTA